MTQYAFGSGTLIGKRTDVANTPPALLGTLESVSLDFDRKVEFLLGQYNMPVAAGGGEFKIAGKAKYARLQATQINNLFLGQTLTANSMLEMTAGAPTAIPSAVSWSGGVFLNATGNPYINLSGWSVTGSGVAGSTGQRANLFGPGYLVTTAATPCNSFFPGNGACALQIGFQDNANDPLTSPIPAGNLPAPTASSLGGIESIVATAHQWIDSISTSGVPHQSQLVTSDLSDVTAPTSWTAADGSGVSLSLTASDTLYAKIGKVCTVSFAITYPTTSNTSTAQVSGIPSVCAAKNGTLNYVAGGTGFGGSGSTGAVYVALQKNGQSLFFFTSGNPQTNANMSGSTVRGKITYITN